MKNTHQEWYERLRRMADQKVQHRSGHVENIDSADLSRLIDEIQIFQVELELQNEEMRHSLEELEKSRTRFSRLFDMAPAGYVVLDESGMILQVNQTLVTMLKKRPDALMGKPFSRFVSSEDQNVFLSRFAAFYKHPENKTLEVRLVSDRRFVCHARLQGGFIPFETVPGRPDIDRFCLIVTDITESKAAEIELKRLAVERIQAEKRIMHLQKTESLGRMAGAMAHHYNNLLTSVMGNLEMAMENLPEHSKISGNLKQAMEAAERISKLGTTMQAYLGQAQTPRERLDLSETCRRAVSELQTDMPSWIEFKIDFPVSGPTVTASAGEIAQILKSLVSNTWEAMEDRPGAIDLSIRWVHPEEITPSQRHPMDFHPVGTAFACIRVHDNGPGIPETHMEKIFDPFYSTKFIGRGLGLPIALGTVKSLGGCITVTSIPGSGTVFQVFIPTVPDTYGPN